MTYVLSNEQLKQFTKNENIVANRVIINIGKRVSKIYVDGYFRKNVLTSKIQEYIN